LALLAALLASAGDSGLIAAGEPQMAAAVSDKETIEVAAAKSQAAPEPDSQESPAIREKDKEAEVSQAVMADHFLSEPLSGSRGLREPALICASVYFPDTERRRGTLEKERQ